MFHCGVSLSAKVWETPVPGSFVCKGQNSNIRHPSTWSTSCQKFSLFLMLVIFHLPLTGSFVDTCSITDISWMSCQMASEHRHLVLNLSIHP